MSAPNDIRHPLHRALPLLALGLVVLGVLVSTSIAWWSKAPEGQIVRWGEDHFLLVPMRQQAGKGLVPARLQSPSPLWTPKLIGALIMTVPVLSCALYVIMSRAYLDADKKWADSAIAALSGFWLGAW